MLTTVIARLKDESNEDVIVNNWKAQPYIPVVGDKVDCLEGTAIVTDRRLRYDDDEHLTAILTVKLLPSSTSMIDAWEALAGKS